MKDKIDFDTTYDCWAEIGGFVFRPHDKYYKVEKKHSEYSDGRSYYFTDDDDVYELYVYWGYGFSGSFIDYPAVDSRDKLHTGTKEECRRVLANILSGEYDFTFTHTHEIEDYVVEDDNEDHPI